MKIELRPEDKVEIAQLSRQLSKNSEVISVEDFGALSKKLKKERSIREIFRTSVSSKTHSALLYRFSASFKPKSILELGTSLGFGTLHLHLGHRSSKVYSVEGCPETYAIAKRLLEKHPITLINKIFDDAIDDMPPGKMDLIFIDGHHDGMALKKYIQKLDPWIHEDTVLILDDIRWSDSMLIAWNELRRSEKFNLSMDFFSMGVLLKRPKQRKEHFYLRIKRW